MIYLITIFIIINAFLAGIFFEEIVDSQSKLWKRLLFLFGCLLVGLIVVVFNFIFEFFKLWFEYSPIGNLWFVFKVRYGYRKLNQEEYEFVQKQTNLKTKSKDKKTLSTRTFIWGGKMIIKFVEEKKIIIHGE